MNTHYDLIIVGGGMVGASLASALKHLSLRIAVLEARPVDTRLTPSYDARAIGLSYGSKTILETLGHWDALSPLATEIKTIHVSHKGHFGAVRFDDNSAEQPAYGYVVEAQSLNKVLTEACLADSSLDYLCPTHVTAIKNTTTGVTVEAEREGQPCTLTCDFLIGADGNFSTVRTLLGIETSVTAYEQTAIVTNVSTQDLHRGRAFERFTQQGPIALLPLSDNRSTLIWINPHEYSQALLAKTDEDFIAAVQKTFGYRLGCFTKVGRRVSYPIMLRVAEQQYQDRVLLMGNATHGLSLIAAQGFNLGLRGVAVLAETLTDSVQAGKPLGHPDSVNAYLKRHAPDQSAMITLTDGLTRLFTASFKPLNMATSLGMVALDRISPLKSLFLKRTMGLQAPVSKLSSGIPL